jgi:hypothetical protein
MTDRPYHSFHIYRIFREGTKVISRLRDCNPVETTVWIRVNETSREDVTYGADIVKP